MTPPYPPQPRYEDAWKPPYVNRWKTKMPNWYGIEDIIDSGGEYWHDYIPGIAGCIIMLGLGIALLVKVKNDAAVTILGTVSTILGAAWVFVYLGMLMGW